MKARQNLLFSSFVVCLTYLDSREIDFDIDDFASTLLILKQNGYNEVSIIGCLNHSYE